MDETGAMSSVTSEVTPTARSERRERLARAFSKFANSQASLVGAAIVLSVVIGGVFAPYLSPYQPSQIDFAAHAEPPSLGHLMGTDTLGRDIFSRVLYGARTSLILIVAVLSVAIGVGAPLGMIAAYVGGPVETIIMRVTDVFLSIPPLVLALAVTAALGPSLFNAMMAISFAWWPWYARLLHGEVLSVKEEEFIEASESLGAGWFRVTFREILPNVVAPITVKATLDMGTVILIGASIAFLGLGVQPPKPAWGAMISNGRDYVTSFWWIAVSPGIAISYTVLGFNLLGDGLRDVLDVEEVE